MFSGGGKVVRFLLLWYDNPVPNPHTTRRIKCIWLVLIAGDEEQEVLLSLVMYAFRHGGSFYFLQSMMTCTRTLVD